MLASLFQLLLLDLVVNGLVVAEHQWTFSTVAEQKYFRDPSRNDTHRFMAGPFRPSGSHTGSPHDPPIHVLITTPARAGRFPVVVFLSGMFGLVPTYWYSDLYHRMAHDGSGLVVVALDVLAAFPTHYSISSAYMQSTVDWIQEGHLQALLIEKGLEQIQADVGRVLLAGHSSGAQSVVDAWSRHSPRIAGLLLLDPVDSYGLPPSQQPPNQSEPLALSKPWAAYPPINLVQWPRLLAKASASLGPPVIDPGNKTQYKDLHQPVFVLSTGLCGVSSFQIPIPKNIPLPPEVTNEDSLWPPCCPKGLGPARFLKGLRGSSLWHVNVTQYGHCDVLSDPWSLTNKVAHFCKSAREWKAPGSKMPIIDFSHLRRLVAGLVAAFVDVTQHQVCEGRFWLEQTQKVHPFAVEMQHTFWPLDENPCLKMSF